MNTERQTLMDYRHILEHNRAVDEEVRENGHSDRRHISINSTTAELFAMMVTASALVEISDTLKAIREEL